MNKNPLVALLLSFIPGIGHAYLGRPFRAVFYGGGFFGPIALMLLMSISSTGTGDGFMLFLFVIAAASAVINFIDMIVGLASGSAIPAPDLTPPPLGAPVGVTGNPFALEQQREKTNTILLSMIPGLGHMSLGLMQRGITFMVAFLGLFAIIIFLSVVMDTGVLLIFLLLLPVIWVYGMFDAIHHLHRKQRGEPMEDRPLFAELEAHVTSGRKNRTLAVVLSFFPGAGHLYLGLQKRGLQLMAGFLIMVYLMDSLRLTLFLFLIPLIICFAFFDALQQIARYEYNAHTDEPLVPLLAPYQKLIGIGLFGFGVYYLVDRVAIELVRGYSQTWYEYYLSVKYMIPTALVAFLMIALGFQLLFGRQREKRSFD